MSCQCPGKADITSSTSAPQTPDAAVDCTERCQWRIYDVPVTAPLRGYSASFAKEQVACSASRPIEIYGGWNAPSRQTASASISGLLRFLQIPALPPVFGCFSILQNIERDTRRSTSDCAGGGPDCELAVVARTSMPTDYHPHLCKPRCRLKSTPIMPYVSSYIPSARQSRHRSSRITVSTLLNDQIQHLSTA